MRLLDRQRVTIGVFLPVPGRHPGRLCKIRVRVTCQADGIIVFYCIIKN